MFVVLPSVVIVYLLVVPMRGSLGAIVHRSLKDLMLLALGLAVYGAVFAFIGARFKRPLLVGLIFIFGWEQMALAFPGYLKKFTVAYYLQALVPHAMPNDSGHQPDPGHFPGDARRSRQPDLAARHPGSSLWLAALRWTARSMC